MCDFVDIMPLTKNNPIDVMSSFAYVKKVMFENDDVRN